MVIKIRFLLSTLLTDLEDIKGEDLINSEVDVVSTDEHLATINSDCNLTFTVIIQKGIGYMPSEDIRDIVGPRFYTN